MRLRITCDYPIKEVKSLVEFASKGINHAHLRVWVKNCGNGSFTGWYYHSGKISARIGTSGHFPLDMHYPGLKRAPSYTVQDWKECLVVVVSHEVRHHFQHKHHKRMSEVDAERWALKKLILYRTSLG